MRTISLLLLLCIFSPECILQKALCQVKVINTIAGNHTIGYSGDGGPATAAELINLFGGIATDILGNVYIADTHNDLVRKVSTAGIISTVVPTFGPTYDNLHIAIDVLGNLYISYPDMSLVVKVSPSGVNTIVAGGAGSGYAGDGGPATLAKLNVPSGLAVDASGNLFIADMSNNVIRKVNAAGIISTIAGTGVAGFYLGEGGPATAAQLYFPQYVTVDVVGNLYLNSGVGGLIRKVSASSGYIYTVAGSGSSGFSGDGGPATAATFYNAGPIAVDGVGNIYIADGGNNRVRKVNTSGVITTIAGSGTRGYVGTMGAAGGYTGDGGPADSAELYAPAGFAFDANWNLIIADAGNYVVRKISPLNNIFFTAGTVQSMSACGNTSTAINIPLQVTDTTAGETINWSVVSAPVHGTLLASYTATSTGGALTPSGLKYTPTTFYTGLDSFTIKATNGSATAYTNVGVTVTAAPTVSIATTYTNICNGSSTRIIIGGNGTPGGGDTIVNQNFNTSLGSWTVDTTGTVGISSDYAAFRDVPNNYSNAMGIYHNPDSTSFALADALGTGSASVTKSRLISPSFSTIGYTNATLFFNQNYKKYTNDTSAEVDVSIDGGTTWTTLKNYTLTYVTDLTAGIHTFIPQTVSLAAYAGLPNVKIRFYYNSKLGRYWALDNIVVMGYPTGINAAMWTPVSNLFTNPGLSSAYATGEFRDTVYMHPTTVTTTTNFKYYATESIGSCPVTDSITITVTPSAPIVGNHAVCVGANDTLTNTTLFGGWSISNAYAYIAFSSGILTGLTSGVDTVRYTTTGSCAGVATFVVTVNAAPPIAGTITGPSSACTGTTITLSDATPGGIWSSTGSSIASVGSSGIVTGVTDGSTVISYTVANGCGTAVTTAGVTVNSLPTAGTVTGASSVCAGAAITLSNVVAGGTWSSGGTSIATIGSVGEVTGMAGGTATISYSVTNDCGTTVATKPITVNTLPSAGTIAGGSVVCVGATITLSDPIAGGSWSSGTGSIATVGSSGIVTGFATGNTAISYTVTNGCGTAVVSAPVTVNPLPVAGIVTGASTVCAGSSILIGDLTPGGIWSSGATSIATVGTAGTVAGISAGTATISYSVSNSCGTAVTNAIITVNALPVSAIISGPSTVCVGASITLTDPSVSGTWSSSVSSVATVGPTGVVVGVSAGATIISYTVTNGCGSVVATKIVTVNPLPVAGSITGTPTVCVLATTSLTDTVTGGTWSSSPASIATVGSTGVVSGVFTGTATIVYTVATSCGSVSSAKIVTVNPLPSAGAITGTPTLCVPGTTLLADAVIGGTWSSSPATVATVSGTGLVSGVSGGIATISYSVTNSCGPANATKMVTVSILPAAGIITGTGTLCEGGTLSLTESVTGGTWSSSATTIATVSGGGIVTGLTAGTVTISYSATNTCGTATAAVTITVNPLPVAGIIAGDSVVCQGATIVFSDPVTGGVWSSSNTSVATVSGTGLAIGVTSGIVSISYSVTNSCGMAAATAIVTVYPLPLAGTITGDSTVCEGAITVLTSAVTGGVWSSSDIGIATISSSGVEVGIAEGSVFISYVVTNSCGSAFASLHVTVNPLPVAGTISGVVSVCAGSTITLTASTPGGAWGSSNASAVASGGAVLGIFAGADTILYTLENTCGADTASLPIVVNPLPDAGTITGPSSVCIDSTINLSSTMPGGTWSSLRAFAAIDVAGIVTGLAPGMDTIKYTATTVCGTVYVDYLITVLSDLACSAGLQVAMLPNTVNGIKIYPNPNEGAFTLLVSSDVQEQTNVIITNITGETVDEFTIWTNVNREIKIIQPSGIYILLVSTAGGNYFAKLMVE